MCTNSQPDHINERLISLDALRGFCMFWLIGGQAMSRQLLTQFGDNQVTNYLLKHLSHVSWDGFHSWDLVMPLFLFIVGVAMPFSFSRRLAGGGSRTRHYCHILKRVAILFILSLVAKGQLQTFDFKNMALFTGVLQSIAIGYLITSIVILNFGVRGQFIILFGMLILYWALVMFVPVPGHGAGVFTQQGNLVIYIDNLFLMNRQMGSGFRIIGSITFGCTVLIGALAGQILISQARNVHKSIILLSAGILIIFAGQLWSLNLPIIKNIWTSSFVLFSGGWCLILLSLFYLIIDVWGLKKWAFGFVVIGLNSIAVYVATQVFSFRTIGDIFIGNLAKWTGNLQGFISELTAFTIIWLILYWMYRTRSFVKI
jgi:predicted acyltransferase